MSRSRSNDLVVAVFAVGCKPEAAAVGACSVSSSTAALAAIAAVPHPRIKTNAMKRLCDFIVEWRKSAVDTLFVNVVGTQTNFFLDSYALPVAKP